MLIQINFWHGFDVCISIVRLNRYVIKSDIQTEQRELKSIYICSF